MSDFDKFCQKWAMDDSERAEFIEFMKEYGVDETILPSLTVNSLQLYYDFFMGLVS